MKKGKRRGKKGVERDLKGLSYSRKGLVLACDWSSSRDWSLNLHEVLPGASSGAMLCEGQACPEFWNIFHDHMPVSFYVHVSRVPTGTQDGQRQMSAPLDSRMETRCRSVDGGEVGTCVSKLFCGAVTAVRAHIASGCFPMTTKSGKVATETTWQTKSKIFTLRPFMENVYWSLITSKPRLARIW
jgi:hypothetical protein